MPITTWAGFMKGLTRLGFVVNFCRGVGKIEREIMSCSASRRAVSLRR